MRSVSMHYVDLRRARQNSRRCCCFDAHAYRFAGASGLLQQLYRVHVLLANAGSQWNKGGVCTKPTVCAHGAAHAATARKHKSLAVQALPASVRYSALLHYCFHDHKYPGCWLAVVLIMRMLRLQTYYRPAGSLILIGSGHST